MESFLFLYNLKLLGTLKIWMTIIETSVNQIDAGMIVFQDRLSEVSHNTPLVYIDVSVTKLITHPTTPFTTKKGHLGVFHGEKIHFSIFSGQNIGVAVQSGFLSNSIQSIYITHRCVSLVSINDETKIYNS